MKIRVLSLALLLPLVACSESGPVGSYALDTEALVADLKAKIEAAGTGEDAPEQGLAEAMVKPLLDMMSKMKVSMDINADGTFVIHSDNPDGTHNHVSGTWTQEGNKLTMKGKDEESGKEETKEAVVRDGNLVMTEEEGGMKMEMVFVRT